MLHIISTDDTALMTVLFAKYITSCNNVFLKGCYLLATSFRICVDKTQVNSDLKH